MSIGGILSVHGTSSHQWMCPVQTRCQEVMVIGNIIPQDIYINYWGAGIAQWFERRTRDRKVASSSPGRVDFLC